MNVRAEKTAPSDAMEERLLTIESQLALLQGEVDEQKRDNLVSLICFSGEWDRLFAALTIAAGALSMGQEVRLFFTFWAVSALRKQEQVHAKDKPFLKKMMGRMLPSGPNAAPLSNMDFFGMGKVALGRIMKEEGIDDLETIWETVRELGATFHLCETSASLLGMPAEELDNSDDLEICGVSTFLTYALKSKTVLFI